MNEIKTSNGIRLSICVAVYNIKEEYLRACIESVTADMSPDSEIILGDDCSNEETAKICREYAERNSRVRYIRPQKNGGVSYIRNVMTDSARGEYLTFIDGDDAVPNGYSTALCGAIKSAESEYDIIMFKWKRFVDNVPNIAAKPMNIEYVSAEAAEEFSRACLTGAPPHSEKYQITESTPSSVCIKVYRRKFLIDNGLKFRVGLKKSQDVEFNTRAYFVCKKLGYLPQILYFYRKNLDSVTNKYNPNIQKIISDCIGYDTENLNRLYQNDDEVNENWQKYKLILYTLNCLELELFHKNNPKTKCERKNDFIGFIRKEPFKSFLKTFDFSDYNWNERRLILKLAANERFKILSFMYKNPITFKIYGKAKSLTDRIKLQIKRG